ncbi:unnamed protein product [Prorocentrum cordatum]|uniref:dolichyl-P-Man:Man5GlcNAc2-PP-dolichol alpha-1,3-mannosyltransferase n=1 Tax=Prorocentrum cordatum TaxID=2364126 RepID=A0ABN9T2C7_9DINO|nr:unnamed protein product [Polarella glacialis]
MWDFLREIGSARYALWWAIGLWACDAFLTILIIRRVPFTDVDWETYMVQVDAVLHGQFDYAQLRGPTGPIAYPAGFCWLYGLLRLSGAAVAQAQVVFAGLYMATLAVVFQIYRQAGAPGWLLILCVLSKRVHSISHRPGGFVLRCFNDAAAQFLAYAALLLFLHRRRCLSLLAYSAAVSVKMQPLLFCPAVGLSLVLAGGWSLALPCVLAALALQAAVAAPFLLVGPGAYLRHAFGGPGDLQHAWSVNWRAVPEDRSIPARWIRPRADGHPRGSPALVRTFAMDTRGAA